MIESGWKGGHGCASPCCLTCGCSRASLSAACGGAHGACPHRHGHMCVHKHTWCLSLFSCLFFFSHFQLKKKKKSLFIYEITGRPFSKGTWLPWVTRCLSATGVILLTAAITGRGWRSQSATCLGNPCCHPRNSRDCVPQRELETSFSRAWSFLCRWASESLSSASLQQPQPAAGWRWI